MRVLEKSDKMHRVMVQIFPINASKKGKGSKSFTVLESTVEEVYPILLEALKVTSLQLAMRNLVRNGKYKGKVKE